MNAISYLFEAFLKCPTKCYLRSVGEAASGNAYAEWVQTQNDTYPGEAIKRLIAELPEAEVVLAPPAAEDLKSAKWRLALDLPLISGNAQTRLHAVERVPSEGRGKPSQFIPIRFVFFNKLTKDDRLLLAYDALILSETLGREVSVGKIIHGDDHATLKVKMPGLMGEVRKIRGKMEALLASASPPDLILIRHCAECDFRDRCRQKAVEKDDLSLLANMTEKERKKFNSKGIFTVTQLSHTFRPRRRPKRLRDKREKYHHALKALAIREKKIHIVGSPVLKIEGTPVYLDVEALPDREFYYLIGAWVRTAEGAVQRSFWAEDIDREKGIWRQFADMLAEIENPVLIHYGCFETAFFKTMGDRYGAPPAESGLARAIKSAINLVSVIFAQVYFPSYSNGLKDVAGYLGFVWSESTPSGLKTILWRHAWEMTKSPGAMEQLINYNAEDCQALETVSSALSQLGSPAEHQKLPAPLDGVIHTELLPRSTMWKKFSSPIAEFEEINKAARWDYQRDRILIRSSKRIRRIVNQSGRGRRALAKPNKVMVRPDQPACPNCGALGYRHLHSTTKILYDIFFSKTGLKKWVVEYHFHFHWCRNCRTRFGVPREFWPGSKYGRNLTAYSVYQIVKLCTPTTIIEKSLRRLFGYDMDTGTIKRFKSHAADFYRESRQMILDRIVRGSLVHIDETRANIKGKTGYVWVFTNLHEVAYLYSDSREGDIAHATLLNFKGVLISDFYSVYDSFDGPQQRCLLHLMRDLNAEILANPFDEGLKQVVMGFAGVLKQVVDTVDRFGLKRHFLQKHHKAVDQFYRRIESLDVQSEAAVKCKQRFEKNRDKLFTFLDYDGVPWNNNNAEHAVKAFAALRDVMEGSSTQKGTEDYLILLSVCQTCEYSGVDFLDFLRSGEKDIEAFASRHGKTRNRRPADLTEPK